MSAATNKALIERYLEEVRGDSPPAVLDRYIAQAELKQHIALYNSVLPGYYLDPEDIIAEDDKVVVRAMVRGKHMGPFMNMPPTGKTVAIGLIIIYRIAGEKIVEHWMQVDMLSFMQQIGALPMAAPVTA